MPTGLLVSPPNPICFNLFLSSSENATEVRGSANGFNELSYGIFILFDAITILEMK